mmetsp:Transcript_3727/g.10583  ORF Transcript_3727/g.10583 Transcript_3727/m.10583 type:complete len:446 (+) Transcript_3727:13-1350(+)
MKENTGKARAEQWRRQTLTNAAALVIICIAFYSVVQIGKTKARNGRSDDVSIIPKFKAVGGRELPLEFQESHRRGLYETWWADHGDKSDRELIVSGEATLVDIAINQKDDGNGGYDATGTFCHVDFYLHKADPTVVPMFRDLVAKSIHCSRRGKIRMDLQSIVDEARAYDARADTATTSLEPAGFVFHESRCGSTLVANSLMAMDPEANRVYSESPPPVTAAKMISGSDGQDSSAVRLLRDVIYMMGRTNDAREKRLFFKIQSIGTKSIPAFMLAYPKTPWVFIHRDAVQVMMSHLKTKDKTEAVCTRSRSAPPSDLVALVKARDPSAKVKKLTTEDYCAAHLASLCEAAYNAYEDSNGIGRFVDYADLPDALVEDIIPNHFGESMNEESKARILKISGTYSKARTVGRTWKEDSQKKEEAARPEIRAASTKYLLPVWEKLKRLS